MIYLKSLKKNISHSELEIKKKHTIKKWSNWLNELWDANEYFDKNLELTSNRLKANSFTVSQFEFMTEVSPIGNGIKNTNLESWLFHTTLGKILSNMSVDENVKEWYLREYEKQSGKQKKDEKALKSKSEKKIIELKKKLNNVQDLFIEGDLSKEDYNQITERYKLELGSLNTVLVVKSDIDNKEFKDFVTWGFGFVKNLSKYYENGTVEAKRLIIGLIFPEKFTFQNNQLRTNLIGDVFLLLCNGSRGLRRIKKTGQFK